MRLVRFAWSLLLSLPLAAQAPPDPAHYEPLLVPVFASGPGAGGSQWTSSMSLVNSGETDIQLTKPVLGTPPALCPSCGCFTTTTLTAQTPSDLCTSLQDPMGMIVWIPRTTPEDDKSLSFHLRVRDTSRGDENAGTEVPVVRERNLRTGQAFWLLHVDTDSRYRVALRFFDILSSDGLPVTVRIYAPLGPQVVTVVTLSYPFRNVAYDPFPLRPAFAMIGDLTGQFPQLRDRGPVDIEIQFAESLADPPYPHKHTYAFASITNNTTQVFTTVTPQ